MINLSFFGDIMLGRGVQSAYETHGAEYVVSGIEPERFADRIVVANLEAPFFSGSASYLGKEKKLSFGIEPKAVEIIKRLGVDCVSLANNHMTDCGLEGIVETQTTLKKNGILFSGAGLDENDAYHFATLNHDSAKIGVLSVCAFIQYVQLATKKKWGVAAFNKNEIVSRLLKRKEFDVVILSIHWGIDYQEFPIPRYVEQIKDIIDKVPNLKIVVGHHPHLIQPIIEYKKAIIACSLGNFLFDEPFPLSRIGMVLNVDIDRSLALQFNQDFVRLSIDNRLELATDMKAETNRIEKTMNSIHGLEAPYLRMNEVSVVRDLIHILQDFSAAKLKMLLSLFTLSEMVCCVATRGLSFLKRKKERSYV